MTIPLQNFLNFFLKIIIKHDAHENPKNPAHPDRLTRGCFCLFWLPCPIPLLDHPLTLTNQMRLNRFIQIINPNGESIMIPKGTKLQTLGKLIQSGGLKYKIHRSEIVNFPRQFQFSAGGIWLCSFYASRIPSRHGEELKAQPINPLIDRPLLADGSRSLNCF